MKRGLWISVEDLDNKAEDEAVGKFMWADDMCRAFAAMMKMQGVAELEARRLDGEYAGWLITEKKDEEPEEK